MDTPNTLLSNHLIWDWKKKKLLLKSDGNTVLRMRCGKKRAKIKSGENNYIIRNKGYWNATTMVEEGDKVIATMKRFLGSTKILIQFENENRYYLRLRNRVLTRLSITSDNKEIVRYKLISKLKAHLDVDISKAEISDKDLLVLIALGYFVFHGILKENKALIDKIAFTASLIGKAETEGI